MKIIDKNMLKIAKRSLENSREMYTHELSDGEVILFSDSTIYSVQNESESYDTKKYDSEGKVIHPNIKSLIKEDLNYNDYRFTDLIYHYSGAGSEAVVEINIPFAHSLSTIQAKYSSIFISDKGLWVELETTFDSSSKMLKATHVVTSGSDELEFYFAVFSNFFWYSAYTKRLAESFPSWSFIHKNKDSNGQRFLNYFGIAFEELEEHFKWISDQHFIGTTDLTQLDWIYKYVNTVEVIGEADLFYSTDSGKEKLVPIIYEIKEFTHNNGNRGIIIDKEKNIVYSQYDYHTLYVKRVDGFTYELTKASHQIWNTLDEFGLLLGVKRHYNEKNYRFIERILDVFRYPSNTSEMGLTHGIARELDMIERYTLDSDGLEVELEWGDDTKPLLIRNRSGMLLDHRTLRVDGRKLIFNLDYAIDKNNNIIIQPLNEFIRHHISIVRGIEKYELYSKDDFELTNLMYRENGLATPMLESWVSYIRKIAPVMWDDFQWDKGYWDTIDKNLTGVGYIPNHWDSSIESWKGKYV